MRALLSNLVFPNKYGTISYRQEVKYVLKYPKFSHKRNLYPLDVPFNPNSSYLLIHTAIFIIPQHYASITLSIQSDY